MAQAHKLKRWVVLASMFAVLGSFVSASPAQAVTPEVVVPAGGVKFLNSVDIGVNALPGFTTRYSNICTGCTEGVGGPAINIDGIVTAQSTNGGRFITLDYTRTVLANTAPINTEMSAGSAGGSVTYQVSFVKAGTDDPVIMKDVYVNVVDIDSRQWAQFSGVQEYSLSSNPATRLAVQTNATNSAIPVGAYRFAETNGLPSTDSDQDFWAQVKYTAASSIIVTLAKGAGSAGTAVFGVSFNPATWSNTPTTVNPNPSVYTLSYDGNGATGGNPPPSSSGSGALNVVGNTGPFTRPGYVFDGWNTQPDGNGVSYANGDTIRPTADTVLYAVWLPNFPQLQVTKIQKTVDPILGGSPGTVDYDVIVKNVGNVPLTNLNLTDTATNASVSLVSCASSVTLPVATLAVGGTFTCTYRATPAATGTIVNTATVTSDQLPAQTSNSVTTIVGGTNDLQVYKIQTSVNPEQAGETVTFDVVIFNAGTLSQSDVTLTDPNATLSLGSCTPQSMSSPITLAAGASVTCPATHTVTQDEIDAGVYRNTATATSTYFTGGVNSNTVTVNFLRFAALDLYKGQSSFAPNVVGDVIVYNILATNIGNVELTNFTVTDPGADPGSLDCGVSMPTTLVPDQQLSCTAVHTVTRADFAAKTFTNVAYATSSELSQQTSNSATTDLSTLADTGSQEPSVTLITGVGSLVAFGGVLMLVLRRRAARAPEAQSTRR